MDIIKKLKAQLLGSNEPFVWATLPKAIIGKEFPKAIRSAWIFVLRACYRTPSHYHPNSQQHTVVIEGDGWTKSGTKKLNFKSSTPATSNKFGTSLVKAFLTNL